MSEDAAGRMVRLVSGGVFLLIAGLIAADLLIDGREGASLFHLLMEGAVLVFALCGAGFAFSRFQKTRRDLVRARSDATRWRAEHEGLVSGLGAAIQTQFEDWGLTPSESEVGLLLLKGLSLGEIAALRGTSERTVREQARAVYRKAELPGRSALSAFFLEDLLPPQTDH